MNTKILASIVGATLLLIGGFVALTPQGKTFGATILFPTGGGTGSSTLSGILIGNGTSPVKTLTIGTNLTLTGTTLSASGGGGSFPFTPTSYGNSTTSIIGFTNGIIANASSTLNIFAINNLTSAGFVKTAAGTGALSVDTSTYLTSAVISGSCSGGTTCSGTNPLAINSFVWPFTLSTYGTQAVNATTTGLWLTSGASPLGLIASSTFVTYASSTQLSASNNVYLTNTKNGPLGTDNNGLVSASTTGPVTAGTGISLDNSTRQIFGGALAITNSGVISGSCSGGTTCSGTNPLSVNSYVWPWTINANTVFFGTVSNSTSTQMHYSGSPFSLTASSTAVFFSASSTSLTNTGATYLTNTKNAALSTDNNGLVVASTTGTVTSGTGISLDNSTRQIFGGTLAITNTGVISGSCSGGTTCSGTNPLSVNSFVWPWSLAATYATNTNATTTPTWFKTNFFASSTITQPAVVDNLVSTNSTSTNATSTSFFATVASTTNFYGAGLNTCQGGNVLTYNGSGKFGCAVDATSAGAANPFTWEDNFGVINAATTSALWAKSGINASSTSNFVNLTATNASSTNLAALSQTTGCATFLAGGALVSTGSACGTGAGGSFPFTQAIYGTQNVSATSTGIWVNSSATPFGVIASSTFTTYASTTQLSASDKVWLTNTKNGPLGTDNNGLVSASTTGTVTAGTGISLDNSTRQIFGGSLAITNSGVISGSCSGGTTCSGTNPLTINSYVWPYTINAATAFFGAVSNSTSTQMHYSGTPTSLSASSTSQFDTSTTTAASIKTLYLPNITSKALGVDANSVTYGIATGTLTVSTGLSIDSSVRSLLGGSAQITNTGVISGSCTGGTTCSGTNPLTVNSFVWPFTLANVFGTANSNATGTLTQFTGGLTASTTVRFGNAGASGQFTWDSLEGALGIGTSSPMWPLTLSSSTNSQLCLTDGSVSNAQGCFRMSNGFFYFASTTAATTATSSPAALTINTNVGSYGFFVGTTSNTAATGLAINGTGYWTGLTASAGLQTGILCLSAKNEIINESVACVASARRFKQDIQPLTAGLDEVLQLRPVAFEWKDNFNGGLKDNPNYSGIQYSLIADEVQKVDPHLVTVETSPTTFEGKDYPAGTVHGLADLNHWVSLFVQSFHDVETKIQGIIARISGLEAKVEAQQKQIDSLQEQINQLKK